MEAATTLSNVWCWVKQGKTFSTNWYANAYVLAIDRVMDGSGLVEHMDNNFLDPFIEGLVDDKKAQWKIFHIKYGQTEFSGYVDGVVVGKANLYLME